MTDRDVNLTGWIGRCESAEDVIGPTPCAALAAMLDRPAQRPAPGTALPPLWHWLYFLPLHRQSDLGPDGHARRGGFLPPVPLARRMWAGGRFAFSEPLRIGDSITRLSTIENVTEKSGRTGPLVFVRVRHEFRRLGEGAAALTEWHDIVYRDVPRAGQSNPQPTPPPVDAQWEQRWLADEVMLFRYSALTFNGHRIHYDRRYVTEVEGYPGLIVHGPLIATLLLESLRANLPEAEIAAFEFKVVRPIFDINPFYVCGARAATGKSVHLWARDHENWLAIDATAMIR